MFIRGNVKRKSEFMVGLDGSVEFVGEGGISRRRVLMLTGSDATYCTLKSNWLVC